MNEDQIEKDAVKEILTEAKNNEEQAKSLTLAQVAANPCINKRLYFKNLVSTLREPLNPKIVRKRKVAGLDCDLSEDELIEKRKKWQSKKLVTGKDYDPDLEYIYDARQYFDPEKEQESVEYRNRREAFLKMKQQQQELTQSQNPVDNNPPLLETPYPVKPFFRGRVHNFRGRIFGPFRGRPMRYRGGRFFPRRGGFYTRGFFMNYPHMPYVNREYPMAEGAWTGNVDPNYGGVEDEVGEEVLYPFEDYGNEDKAEYMVNNDFNDEGDVSDGSSGVEKKKKKLKKVKKKKNKRVHKKRSSSSRKGENPGTDEEEGNDDLDDDSADDESSKEKLKKLKKKLKRKQLLLKNFDLKVSQKAMDENLGGDDDTGRFKKDDVVNYKNDGDSFNYTHHDKYDNGIGNNESFSSFSDDDNNFKKKTVSKNKNFRKYKFKNDNYHSRSSLSSQSSKYNLEDAENGKNKSFKNKSETFIDNSFSEISEECDKVNQIKSGGRMDDIDKETDNLDHKFTDEDDELELIKEGKKLQEVIQKTEELLFGLGNCVSFTKIKHYAKSYYLNTDIDEKLKVFLSRRIERSCSEVAFYSPTYLEMLKSSQKINHSKDDIDLFTHDAYSEENSCNFEKKYRINRVIKSKSGHSSRSARDRDQSAEKYFSDSSEGKSDISQVSSQSNISLSKERESDESQNKNTTNNSREILKKSPVTNFSASQPLHCKMKTAKKSFSPITIDKRTPPPASDLKSSQDKKTKLRSRSGSSKKYVDDRFTGKKFENLQIRVTNSPFYDSKNTPPVNYDPPKKLYNNCDDSVNNYDLRDKSGKYLEPKSYHRDRGTYYEADKPHYDQRFQMSNRGHNQFYGQDFSYGNKYPYVRDSYKTTNFIDPNEKDDYFKRNYRNSDSNRYWGSSQNFEDPGTAMFSSRSCKPTEELFYDSQPFRNRDFIENYNLKSQSRYSRESGGQKYFKNDLYTSRYGIPYSNDYKNDVEPYYAPSTSSTKFKPGYSDTLDEVNSDQQDFNEKKSVYARLGKKFNNAVQETESKRFYTTNKHRDFESESHHYSRTKLESEDVYYNTHTKAEDKPFRPSKKIREVQDDGRKYVSKQYGGVPLPSHTNYDEDYRRASSRSTRSPSLNSKKTKPDFNDDDKKIKSKSSKVLQSTVSLVKR